MGDPGVYLFRRGALRYLESVTDQHDGEAELALHVAKPVEDLGLDGDIARGHWGVTFDQLSAMLSSSVLPEATCVQATLHRLLAVAT